MINIIAANISLCQRIYFMKIFYLKALELLYHPDIYLSNNVLLQIKRLAF